MPEHDGPPGSKAGQPRPEESKPDLPAGGTVDFLLDLGAASRHDLAIAQRARRQDETIGQTLVRLGLVRPGDYNEAMLSLGGTARIEKVYVDRRLFEGITPLFLAEQRLLPLYREGDKLHFVHAGNPPFDAMVTLQQVTGASITRGDEITEDQFRRLFQHHFPTVEIPPRAAEAPVPAGGPDEAGPTPAPPSSRPEVAEVVDTVDDTEAMRIVNNVVREALLKGATDVHFEPGRDHLRIRYRIDGQLTEQGLVQDRFARAVAARIKVLARMRIDVTFRPQSGCLSLLVDGRCYEMRVSVLPTIYGESVVLRVLPQSGAETPLEARGMCGSTLDRFCGLIQRSSGIILVTGPTGSGKSSTLFSALHRISTPDLKVITLEDPAEYKLDGLIQSSIDASRGYGFADGLREILRHDPDVIFVGEIRDRETAEIAVQAALTGHLVLSTLHTIDAPSSIMRLVDIGVPTYQIEAALAGVLAQRLVRRVCPHCAQTVRTPHEELARHGFSVPPGDYPLSRPAGCDKCDRTGYRGRTGIYELMVVNEEIRTLVRSGAGVDALRQAALREGMVPLLASGQARILEGVTTVEEVLSACR